MLCTAAFFVFAMSTKPKNTDHGTPPDAPQFAKARTLARLLDCSPRQIGYMAERGQIRPIRLGPRAVRYDVRETLERLKGQR